MTENAFAAMPADAPDSQRRRLFILGGSLVAVAALGFGGYTLLGGSSSDSASVAPVVQHHVFPKPAAKSAVTRTTKVTTVPVVTRQRIGKDPFLALYIQPAQAPAAATAPTTTTTSTTASQPVTTTYALKLVRVYGTGKDTTGVFTINSKSQLAKVGTVFGPTSEIKLMSLSRNAKGVWTATVQVGDGSPVETTLGQAITVR